MKRKTPRSWLNELLVIENNKGFNKNEVISTFNQAVVELSRKEENLKDDYYIQIWIRFLLFHYTSGSNREAVEQYFKYIELNSIGNKCSLLYITIALLEHKFGSPTKSLTILRKAQKLRAQPLIFVENAIQMHHEGKFQKFEIKKNVDEYYSSKTSQMLMNDQEESMFFGQKIINSLTTDSKTVVINNIPEINSNNEQSYKGKNMFNDFDIDDDEDSLLASIRRGVESTTFSSDDYMTASTKKKNNSTQPSRSTGGGSMMSMSFTATEPSQWETNKKKTKNYDRNQDVDGNLTMKSNNSQIGDMNRRSVSSNKSLTVGTSLSTLGEGSSAKRNIGQIYNNNSETLVKNNDIIMAPDFDSKRRKVAFQNNSGHAHNKHYFNQIENKISEKTKKDKEDALSGFFGDISSDEMYIFVNRIKYLKLGLLGKGGSSKVFKCLTNIGEVVAIKQVRLIGPSEIVDSFINEVKLLKDLQGEENKHIVKLIDSEIDTKNKWLFLVMECGDVDLNVLLKRQMNSALKINLIRLYWEQMLEAVHSIHKKRIVHGDLKPANFLLVKGNLKLIDFGIAKRIANENTTNIVRNSQVGTVNYISPEALIENTEATVNPMKPKYKVGRSSDIWSLGCILCQMVTGYAPFAHLSMINKLKAITNNEYIISIPADVNSLIHDILTKTLRRNPSKRPSIPELLDHPFIKTGKITRNMVTRRDCAKLINRNSQVLLSSTYSNLEKEKYACRMIEDIQKNSIQVDDILQYKIR